MHVIAGSQAIGETTGGADRGLGGKSGAYAPTGVRARRVLCSGDMLPGRHTFSMVVVCSLASASCGGVVESRPGDGVSPSDGNAPAAYDGELCTMDDCGSSGCLPETVGAAGSVWQLAARSKSVYFAALGAGVYGASGTVGSFDRCGSDPRTLAAGEKAPYGLAASDAGACWSNLGMTVNGGYNGDGSVRCTGKSGWQELYAGGDRPFGIAMDATDVYFGTYSPFTIRAARPDGTGLRVVYAGGWEDGDNVAMGLDDSHVYWSSYEGIKRVPNAGGEASTVSAGTWDVRDIWVDGSRVYFNDFAAGKVLSVPKTGGSVTTLASPGDVGNQMAMDDRYVYYLGRGGVYRVAKAAGTPQLLGSGADQYALAADEDYVYWVEYAGFVKRLRKPVP